MKQNTAWGGLSCLLRRMPDPRNWALVNRLRYRVGLLPRVNRHLAAPPFYPPRARAGLVITADFELAWGSRYDLCAPDPLRLSRERAAQERKNVPQLLALLDRHYVPITWAAVGHLFLDHCERHDRLAHPEAGRPPCFENEWVRYAGGDWFDADPCTDYRRDPAWYAPDLIHAIMQAEAGHEIGCHTFSHIDCSDERCPAEVMDSELAQCQRLAGERGLRLTSLVFPFGVVGNLASLRRHGFNAYRCHGRYHLDVPSLDGFGLWQIPGGIHLEKPRGWPTDAWVKVLCRCVDTALATGTILQLWFHPYCDPVNVQAVFPALLDYVDTVRPELWVTTMAGLVDRLVAMSKA